MKKISFLASLCLCGGCAVLFVLFHIGCTGSGAVNPLTPSKSTQPDSASTSDSDVVYWSAFPVTFSVTDPLNGVFLVSKNLGWACGNNGLVLKYDGDTWSKVDTGLAKNENLLAVTFANENEGWMVGSHGTILAYKNGAWSQEASPTQENLNCVDVTRSKTVWVVGSNGTILTYNGVSWGKIGALTAESAGASPTTITEDLYGVGFSDQNNGWAVGNRGTILRYDGQKWQPYGASPSSEKLNSVSVISDVQAWIVGAFGNILRYNGTTWNKMGSAFSGFDLYQIFMKDDNNGWATGQDGTLIYYDGSRWISHPKPASKPALNAVSFYKDLGFVVGSNGTILKFQPNGEVSKFAFLFKGEISKKPAKAGPYWTVSYTLMNQSAKTSSFATFELPIPKGFEPYQPKETPTPSSTPTAGAPLSLITPTPTPSATGTVTPVLDNSAPQAGGHLPTAVSGAWKIKDNILQWEIGTVASSEVKTITVLLQEKKNEKKDFPVLLKAVLKSTDKLLTEALPVTLLSAPSAQPKPPPIPLPLPAGKLTVQNKVDLQKGGSTLAQPTSTPGN